MTQQIGGEHKWGGNELRRAARSAMKPSEAIRRAGLDRSLPELMAMATSPQDPGWHPEGDVLTHSLLAADAAASAWDAERRRDGRREIVVLAALFHDVGKPATTRVTLGRLTSPGHAEVGKSLVLRMSRRLSWPDDLSLAVAELTANHMVHLSVKGDPTPRAVRRLTERLTAQGTSLEEWSVLVNADGAARGSASIPDRAAPWLRVANSLQCP